MTKSKGVGRGGKRPGAGRKNKIGAAYVHLLAADQSPPAPETLAPKPIEPVEHAVSLTGLALGVLKQILESSPSDQARVAAAREVFNRSVADSGRGKKAQIQERAHGMAAQGGLFAPPQPPNKATVQ